MVLPAHALMDCPSPGRDATTAGAFHCGGRARAFSGHALVASAAPIAQRADLVLVSVRLGQVPGQTCRVDVFCLSYLGALCDLSEAGLVDHVLLRMFARMLDVRGSMSGGYIARLRRGKSRTSNHRSCDHHGDEHS